MRGVTICATMKLKAILFQLTRLMRGVTFDAQTMRENIINFNSHASCEA